MVVILAPLGSSAPKRTRAPITRKASEGNAPKPRFNSDNVSSTAAMTAGGADMVEKNSTRVNNVKLTNTAQSTTRTEKKENKKKAMKRNSQQNENKKKSTENKEQGNRGIKNRLLGLVVICSICNPESCYRHLNIAHKVPIV